MLTVQKIDPTHKNQAKWFVELPYRLYRDCPQWVPPLFIDAYLPLNKKKHPYFEHSDGDFFLALRDGKPVGRIGVFENTRYNQAHQKKQAHFYFFDCEEDPEAAQALFEQGFGWARMRGLNQVVGPKGLSAFDGYGMLQEGFEHRQMMTMMNYNYPYYNTFAEAAGFRKEVDFVSCYVNPATYQVPERLQRIVKRVEEKGTLRAVRFNTKNELRKWIQRVGQAYNDTFINNWEYYPLTPREVQFVADNLLQVADPKMLKIIVHGEQVVGFLFAFPDVSKALQRARGRLFPFGLLDLLFEMRRTDWVSANGMGILPEYHGRGANALLYVEMVHTLQQYPFKHAEMTQVAETAEQMRADLDNLGGKAYKNHRVYIRDV